MRLTAMLRWLASVKPGRLFWKLFAAFTLATGTSFLIGIGLLELSRHDPLPTQPTIETPVQIAQLVQTEGVTAALPLLRAQQEAGNIGLFRSDGSWIAGARYIVHDGSQLALRSPDGTRLLLIAGPSAALRLNRTFPLIIGALVSLFFSAIMAWYLARPLTHLSRGFRAVGAGQLATRVHPHIGSRRDEIADLTREFDGMAAQLQQLVDSQQRLLHDISHELRSPLARLQVAIGLLRQAPDRLPDMLVRVEREAERLDQLIEELLTLARLKAGAPEPSAARIDLIDLLAAIVEDARFEARAKACDVEFEPDGSFVTLAYGELLYRAFENIIRNAVKFSPEHSRIDVRAEIRDDLLLVRVADHGPGVPRELLDEIFEPFKRAGETEGSGPTGFGLGLAIARFAIERHGGSVIAKPVGTETGLAIEIRLPRRAEID